jgi:hypothetical protein
MSDALIYASVRAWSSRFSPWQLSASTRLKQCNGRFQDTLKYRFPYLPSKRKGQTPFRAPFHPHSSASLVLFKYCPPSKTHSLRPSAAA